MPRRNDTGWVEGDIVYLKTWDADTSEAYQAAGVGEGAADHPAVVLYRSALNADYAVVACMTSLRGKPLSEHPWANRSIENKRGLIPIRPSPENPANPLQLTMKRHACGKNSHINVGNIYCLPSHVLQRFRLKKRKDLSLDKQSIVSLVDFITTDPRFSKSFAKAKDTARIRELRIPLPVQPTAPAEAPIPSTHFTDALLHDMAVQSLAASSRPPPGRSSAPSVVPIAYRTIHVPSYRIPAVPAQRSGSYWSWFWSQRGRSERQPLLGHPSRKPDPSSFGVPEILSLLVLLGLVAGSVYGAVWLVEGAWSLAVRYLTPSSIWAGIKYLAAWIGRHAVSAAKGVGSWLWSFVARP